MIDKFEQLFYFGLGSALLVKEKIETAGDTTRGLRAEGDRMAREFYDKAVAKGSEERNQVKESIKELIREAIDELGLATRADLDALREELVRLRQGQH
jgi:polyhydroxyalkanoate synthesis regulator phasin